MKNSLLTSSRLRIWRGVIAVLIISAVPAFSATWTVTSTGDDPNDTATLRGALHAAASGDTIDLTSLTGTITLTYGALPVDRELGVNASVAIQGPGASKLAIDGNNFSRVFHVFVGLTVTISGLTIKNGSQSGDTDLTSTGGGIRNSGTLTLTDCAITGNSASSHGGGVYNFPGKTLVVTNCTLSNNSASSSGGAIYNGGGGSTIVSESTLSNNSASAGGGIYSDQPAGGVAVSYSTFSGNSAVAGSGIYNFGGTLVVTNSTLSGNVAGTSDVLGSGAGILNDNYYGYIASATVTNSMFSNNTIVSPSPGGTQGGSAITNFSGEMTVTGSTFSGNTGNSGSLWNDGTLVVSNSTFTGNDTVILNQYNASFINSTLAGNGNADSFDNTGGILNAENGTVTLKNTILANTPHANCTNFGTLTSQDHNISNDTSCDTFLIQPNDFAPHTDPGLDSAGLKDNGGPTKTIALVPGSVAVNAINPSSDCSGVTTDQRGIARPQGYYCDIGAYEATPDFYFTPISAITANVGGSGTASVQVSSFVEFSSAVTLTASGVPGDFSTSLSANPVTPPSDGSASSKLTVNIGPSVTAGSYSFNVVGTSGALTHSTLANVTVGVTAGSVSTVIGTTQALGCVDNSGISNALIVKLNAAQAYIAAGDIQSAINTLTALLNQLNAQAGKHIKTTCTDANGNTFDPVQVLIADVQALLASLGANVIKPNPVMGYAVNSTNAGVAGATVSIVNSARTVVASVTTDATGFYFVAKTSVFARGSNYTVKVTPPKPYKSSTSPTFTWNAVAVSVASSVLN